MADSYAIFPLGSITTWLSGGTPDRSRDSYWGGPIPWISAATLKTFAVDESDQGITQDALRAGGKMAPVGSTLILVRGMSLHREVRAGVVTRPVSFNQDIKALVPMRSLNPRFLTYSLLAHGSQILRLVTSAGSGTGVLETGPLKRLQIWLPALSEQTRLVEILDHVEGHVAALEHLIVKKKAIKQGMMQQLLTGRVRLPGFAQPWAVRTIGDVASIDPDSLGSETNADEVIDYISLEDVSRGVLLGSSRVKFRDAPSRARRGIQNHDVLFGTVRPNLQSHLLYTGSLSRPVASTGFAVVRSITGLSDPRFIFHLLMSNLTAVQVDRIIAGSNYPAVSSKDIRGLRFGLPDVAEQAAIGTALTDCDVNIQTLRVRLAKAKAIKQGMMQELLTGRTRLPVEEALAA